MRILLAKPRGFCAGVNMAIECLRRALETFGAPVYVFHEIVHNKWVVQRFRDEGAIFVNSLNDVPEGTVVLYSAHGVSPEIRRAAAERGLRTVDATCPLVTKVHRQAARFAAAGYTIVLIGHAGHDEIVGVMGEAPGVIQLVQRKADIAALNVSDPERVVYLTQTTLSVDEAAEITAALRERFPAIIGPQQDDICYATQNRQEAVRTLAQEADVVLVVGSHNSSNSRRLAELARASGVSAYLVDGPDDIHLAWFRGEETVVITAGASAPEDIVQRCAELLQTHFDAAVESRVFREEQVAFLLPESLRALGGEAR